MSSTNYVEAPELGEILSGLPGEYVADREKMESIARGSNMELLALDQILKQQEDLQASIDRFVSITRRVGGESVQGDGSSEEIHGEHS
jgi:hypothetical protein